MDGIFQGSKYRCLGIPQCEYEHLKLNKWKSWETSHQTADPPPKDCMSSSFLSQSDVRIRRKEDGLILPEAKAGVLPWTGGSDGGKGTRIGMVSWGC